MFHQWRVCQWLFIDQQIYWLIVEIRGWGGRASCILFEQVAPRSRDELFLYKASYPRYYLCLTSSFFTCSSSQFGPTFCRDQPCQVVLLDDFSSSRNLVFLLSLPGGCEVKCYVIFYLNSPLESVSCDKLRSLKANESHLTFNGLLTYRGGVTGVLLYDSDGTSVSLSFNLEFFTLIMKLNTMLWSRDSSLPYI